MHTEYTGQGSKSCPKWNRIWWHDTSSCHFEWQATGNLWIIYLWNFLFDVSRPQLMDNWKHRKENCRWKWTVPTFTFLCCPACTFQVSSCEQKHVVASSPFYTQTLSMYTVPYAAFALGLPKRSSISLESPFVSLLLCSDPLQVLVPPLLVGILLFIVSSINNSVHESRCTCKEWACLWSQCTCTPLSIHSASPCSLIYLFTNGNWGSAVATCVTFQSHAKEQEEITRKRS